MPLPIIAAGAAAGSAFPTLPVIGGAASFLGGMFGQSSENKNREKDRKLQQELGRRNAGLQEGTAAAGLQRQTDSAPIRNQLLNIMSARAGLPVQAFQGRDIFNPSISSEVPQLGGIDQAALGRATQASAIGDSRQRQFVNTEIPEEVIRRLMNPGELTKDPNAAQNEQRRQELLARMRKIFGR